MCICLCFFQSWVCKEADSRIRLFVPCLDKGRCFLCCLRAHCVEAVVIYYWKVYNKAPWLVYRASSTGWLGGGGWGGNGNAVGGPPPASSIQQDGYTVNRGMGVCVFMGVTQKNWVRCWQPPAANAGLGLTQLSVYPSVTSSQHPVLYTGIPTLPTSYTNPPLSPHPQLACWQVFHRATEIQYEVIVESEAMKGRHSSRRWLIEQHAQSPTQLMGKIKGCCFK